MTSLAQRSWDAFSAEDREERRALGGLTLKMYDEAEVPLDHALRHWSYREFPRDLGHISKIYNGEVIGSYLEAGGNPDGFHGAVEVDVDPAARGEVRRRPNDLDAPAVGRGVRHETVELDGIVTGGRSSRTPAPRSTMSARPRRRSRSWSGSRGACSVARTRSRRRLSVAFKKRERRSASTRCFRRERAPKMITQNHLRT